MQPNTSRKVYLNPSFRNTHINPNFLPSKPSFIHVNPEFLQRFHDTTNVKDLPCRQLEISAVVPNTLLSHTPKQETAKIISKSRTKIVREPMKQNVLNIGNKSPMIRIGRTKLVRASAVSENVPFMTRLSTGATASNKPSIVNRGKYKVDRRTFRKTALNLKSIKRPTFVSKYALRRGNVNESLSCRKLIVTKRKLLKIGAPNQTFSKEQFLTGSLNKKLQLLNINGVLYRSTKNKLQKADTRDTKKLIGQRTVFIKGDKFILDKSGKSLTRIVVPNSEKMKLKRIDIGGLTYVAKSNNLFVRTETHKARNHLSLAKQKSINTLSKNVVKTNIPCPIYRKVGKCAGFERGKCPKVHDENQVAICPKFLKGECSNGKCLLSHNVTLSKMPTCKFFLQGVCVRENCPYLHKKLGEDAKICFEFLRGFCQQADKCNKRHDFVCPDFERTGKCDKVKCIYCSKRKKAEIYIDKVHKTSLQQQNSPRKKDESEDRSVTSRYFIDESRNCTNSKDGNAEKKVIVQDSKKPEDSIKSSETILGRRPKLGVLPAFIPL